MLTEAEMRARYLDACMNVFLVLRNKGTPNMKDGGSICCHYGMLHEELMRILMNGGPWAQALAKEAAEAAHDKD